MPDGLRTNATDYESDFFLWTQEQGLRLRALARTEDASVDWENIAEEIESLGRRERIEIESRLETLLEQLLIPTLEETDSLGISLGSDF